MNHVLTRISRAKRYIIKERYAEAINLIIYFGWAWSMLADGGMLQLHAYRGFTAPAWIYGIPFLVLAALTLIGMIHSCWCRRVAAASMMIGGFVWSLISVEFWYSYPPWQPGMLICPGIAAINYLLALDLEKDAECMEQ